MAVANLRASKAKIRRIYIATNMSLGFTVFRSNWRTSWQVRMTMRWAAHRCVGRKLKRSTAILQT